MTALLRYQTALLARSQRWLAPLLLYAAVLAVGLQGGQPVLGSLGVAAAALLPVTAWAVHLCVTQEPPAARTVASAAVGRRRVHLAALLTATGCAAALAVVSTAVVLLVSSPVTDDGAHAVSRPSAALAGLTAALCCVLLGAVVGALSSRPVTVRRGWSVAAAVLGSLLALVTTGSPARYAVTALVAGSRTGTFQPPVLPLLGAAVLAGAVALAVCRLAARRG
ncbi:ABC transporter [Streptomyces sp. MW-W600-10]|uniref:ABC transporter n=1 Tax=Streptomyces sp. MW-W600-10 TaxID=2829819 RepID=UPI001C45FDE1|nr:ABC transporter [Streptomyces sp. MW-W600-10]MBV7243557.1 ABC transporter [Streptomyces sp. MW-W600-10]